MQFNNLEPKLWIIKPGENSNRGNGIQICTNLKDIRKLINNKIHSNGDKFTYIIQKYIHNPLLYNKRKFDIRCYLLITNF